MKNVLRSPGWPIPPVLIWAVLAACLAYQSVDAWQYFTRVVNGLDRNNCRVGGDFVNMWTAARLVIEHNLAPLFDFDAYEIVQKKLFGDKVAFHNWSYPPHILPFIVPLGLMPYYVALALWTALTFAMYAFAVAWKRPGAWMLVLILLLAPASWENIRVGQNGFWMAALMVGGLRLLGPRPALAGVLFGLLTFKPHFALLVPVALIAGRQWKALGAAALTALALGGFSVALFGIEPWVQYFRVIAPYQRALMELPTFPELHHYMKRMPTFFMAARIVGALRPGAYLLAAIAAIAMALATFMLFAKRPSGKTARLRDPLFLTAAVLVLPYAFVYDMTLTTVAVIGFLDWKGAKGRLSWKEALLLAAVWFLPALTQIFHGARLPVAPFVLLAFFLHMLEPYESRTDSQRS
jgi:hypothetical protein